MNSFQQGMLLEKIHVPKEKNLMKMLVLAKENS